MTPSLPPVTTIAISQVEGAINRARARQPPSGAESALSLEVSTLAALYGRMIFERRERVEFESLSDGEQVALRLWMPRDRADAAG